MTDKVSFYLDDKLVEAIKTKPFGILLKEKIFIYLIFVIVIKLDIKLMVIVGLV